MATSFVLTTKLGSGLMGMTQRTKPGDELIFSQRCGSRDITSMTAELTSEEEAALTRIFGKDGETPASV